MAGQAEDPRTVLEALIRQRPQTYDELAREFDEVARAAQERATISSRHLRRLAAGERSGRAIAATTPATQRVLERLFDRPLTELLAPYSEHGPLTSPRGRLTARAPDERTMLEMATRRSRQFALAHAESLSGQSLELVHEDVHALAVDYQQRPLGELLGDLTEAQDTIFTLLERGKARPAQQRDLYFLGGVTCALLAKASHDMRDPHSALTQARTAYLCADQAEHSALCGWIRGLQSLVAYWAGRPREAVRYAEQGAALLRSRPGTTAVWLPISEARAWAALGHAENTRAAITRAEDAWPSVEPDTVDELGGLLTFSRPRQLYYAADALAWLPHEARLGEDYATQAVAGYEDRSDPHWAFGDAAGSACDLAIVRLHLGDLDAATAAIESVLDLPPAQRINGIIASANRVHEVLRNSTLADAGTELQERIEEFTRTPLPTLPR